MEYTSAQCYITGISPYSQSRQHEEPNLEGEAKDAYDQRTWKSKLTVETYNGKPTVVVPAHGMAQSIQAAAKYSKRQIPNQGKATWTQKFLSGIAILENIPLNIHPDSVRCAVISSNADGVRGSGKRVPRRFPVIDPPWEANFEVQILDPIITHEVFSEMLTLSGMFIGIGRFRHEKGGTNGRFLVTKIDWSDKRRIAA